jgi:hypothetical protein
VPGFAGSGVDPLDDDFVGFAELGVLAAAGFEGIQGPDVAALEFERAIGYVRQAFWPLREFTDRLLKPRSPGRRPAHGEPAHPCAPALQQPPSAASKPPNLLLI